MCWIFLCMQLVSYFGFSPLFLKKVFFRCRKIFGKIRVPLSKEFILVCLFFEFYDLTISVEVAAIQFVSYNIWHIPGLGGVSQWDFLIYLFWTWKFYWKNWIVYWFWKNNFLNYLFVHLALVVEIFSLYIWIIVNIHCMISIHKWHFLLEVLDLKQTYQCCVKQQTLYLPPHFQ